MPAKMTYPATSGETRRERRERLALTRRAQRVPFEPVAVEPVARMNTRGLTMSFATFQAGDYGQVCQLLGLSPSRPHVSADGTTRRRRRSR